MQHSNLSVDHAMALRVPLKVSVITVCFNNEATIGQTIQSVNEQSYAHVEHVFVDGGSRDNTLSVINGESRVERTIISECDSGIYDALNKGIKASTGDVVGFLHADDFFAHAKSIENIARGFERSDVAGVYGDLQYVSSTDTSRVIRYWRTREFSATRLRCGWMAPHPTLYVRRHWYGRIGDFDLQYSISADYFSMLQLFSNPEFLTSYIPEVLVKMRVGGASNRSLKNIIRKSTEDFHALRRSGVGGFGTLCAKNFRKLGQFIT